MASKAEEIASRTLRAILAGLPTGATIDDSEEFRDVLTELEWFLPGVLAEIHSEWTGESLDGLYPHVARKTGEREAEIFGLCCLMSDQKLTCMPIRKGKDIDGISVRELPGGRCVSLLHKGPYQDLSRSYAKILAYIKEKEYEIALSTREVYLKGPGMIFRGNPKNYKTSP